MSAEDKTAHSALVTDWSQSAPTYTSIPYPSLPSTSEEEVVQIELLASGVHQITRSRAAGKHYSASYLPHTAGTDGVGYILASTSDTSAAKKDEKQMVWFSTMAPNRGSMASVLNAPREHTVPLPAEADPVQVAALVNPVMSSWMALTQRVTDPVLITHPANDDTQKRNGFTVLIMGVTSTSGRVAVNVARRLGATHVIGVARNAEKMASIPGLDQRIILREPAAETDFASVLNKTKVDVVLDYVWGPPAMHLLRSLNTKAGPVQYVMTGGLAGQEAQADSAVLRSKNVSIKGTGPGAWDMRDLRREMPHIIQAVVGLGEKQPVRVEKLADVETVWHTQGDGRLVLVP